MRDDDIDNWKLEFDFGEDARREAESGEPVDFTGQAPLGKCPKTHGKVYEFGANYVCEHSVGPTPTCDFRSGKVILQQPVPREQMTKLLASGATELLDGFVSNKTRRKFKARLEWDAKEGKVVFAFEPRPERRPAAAKKAGAALRPPAAAATVDTVRLQRRARRRPRRRLRRRRRQQGRLPSSASPLSRKPPRARQARAAERSVDAARQQQALGGSRLRKSNGRRWSTLSISSRSRS